MSNTDWGLRTEIIKQIYLGGIERKVLYEDGRGWGEARACSVST